MFDALNRILTGPTRQDRPIPGRQADMAANNAGGYSFQLDRWARLDRFLVLGTDGGTFYVGERDLTVDNLAPDVVPCHHRRRRLLRCGIAFRLLDQLA
jgi:60 kDa SS-A/Ro ribonucleoprotein